MTRRAFPSADERFMRAALEEADRAADEGEVPVGAVVAFEGRILGRGHNRTIGATDPTAHAEVLAIGAAAQALASWRLGGSTLYVTIEPCPMCMGAALWARVKEVVFGAADPKAGAAGSLLDLSRISGFHHRLRVRPGLLADECGERMTSFFRSLRTARMN